MFGAGLGPLVFVVMIQKVTIPKVALFGATGRLFFTGGRPAFVVMGRLFVLSGLFWLQVGSHNYMLAYKP